MSVDIKGWSYEAYPITNGYKFIITDPDGAEWGYNSQYSYFAGGSKFWPIKTSAEDRRYYVYSQRESKVKREARRKVKECAEKKAVLDAPKRLPTFKETF